MAKASPHDALAAYEKSLSHYPDHCAAIVGLGTILLDIYDQIIPAEAPSAISIPSTVSTLSSPTHTPSPETLTRLAARDRAYHLLSSVTKSQDGWDDSEAWSLLARACEASGQVDRQRDCLWFCVELEDGRAVRGWDVVRGW